MQQEQESISVEQAIVQLADFLRVRNDLLDDANLVVLFPHVFSTSVLETACHVIQRCRATHVAIVRGQEGRSIPLSEICKRLREAGIKEDAIVSPRVPTGTQEEVVDCFRTLKEKEFRAMGCVCVSDPYRISWHREVVRRECFESKPDARVSPEHLPRKPDHLPNRAEVRVAYPDGLSITHFLPKKKMENDEGASVEQEFVHMLAATVRRLRLLPGTDVPAEIAALAERFHTMAYSRLAEMGRPTLS